MRDPKDISPNYSKPKSGDPNRPLSTFSWFGPTGGKIEIHVSDRVHAECFWNSRKATA